MCTWSNVNEPRIRKKIEKCTGTYFFYQVPEGTKVYKALAGKYVCMKIEYKNNEECRKYCLSEN